MSDQKTFKGEVESALEKARQNWLEYALVALVLGLIGGVVAIVVVFAKQMSKGDHVGCKSNDDCKKPGMTTTDMECAVIGNRGVCVAKSAACVTEGNEKCGGAKFCRRSDAFGEQCFCNPRQTTGTQEACVPMPPTDMDAVYATHGGSPGDASTADLNRYIEWHAGPPGYWSIEDIERVVDPETSDPRPTALANWTPADGIPVENTDVLRNPNQRNRYCVSGLKKSNRIYEACNGPDKICVAGKCWDPAKAPNESMWKDPALIAECVVVVALFAALLAVKIYKHKRSTAAEESP